MSAGQFGPKQVEGKGALRRWSKTGFAVLRRSWAVLVPMLALYTLVFASLLNALDKGSHVARLLICLVIVVCSTFWKAGLLYVAQQAFDGKRVTWESMQNGLLTFWNKTEIRNRFFKYNVIFGIVMVCIFSLVTFFSGESESSKTMPSNFYQGWVLQMWLLGLSAMLVFVISWASSGITALDHSLAVSKVDIQHYELIRMNEILATRLNPFLTRIGLLGMPFMFVYIIFALLFPFALVVLILLESLWICVVTAAYKEIFEDKTKLEVKETVAEKVTSSNLSPV